LEPRIPTTQPHAAGETFAAAFETARSLTIEVAHTPEFDRAAERALKVQGGNVESLAGPERLRRIRAAGARYGVQLQALRQFEPWALYVLFSLPPAEIQGSRRTLDFALQDRAGAQVPVLAPGAYRRLAGRETPRELVRLAARLRVGRARSARLGRRDLGSLTPAANRAAAPAGGGAARGIWGWTA
jgi:hypothetical protein